jgi:hypothetical protein
MVPGNTAELRLHEAFDVLDQLIEQDEKPE